MGFFGSVFKGIKKVAGKAARVAASRLTGGVSDIVLKKLKGSGRVKQALAARGHRPTAQDQALVNKAFPDEFSPNVQQTEQVLDRVGSRAGVVGYNDRGTIRKKRRAGKPKPSQAMMEQQYRRDAAAARAREGRPSKKKIPKTRKSTAQGQKMKRLAGVWRGMGGRAGTGQTFFEWKRGK